MPTAPNTNCLIWIVLGGGTVFLIAAIAIVLMLLTGSAPSAVPVVVAVNTAPVGTLHAPTKVSANPDDLMPSITPLPHPTVTSTPASTATPHAASVTGDKLTLPTATPSPSPSPTTTSTPILQMIEGLRVGNIAPDFTLGSNRASRVSLSDLRGKIVILNFWASWCPPCRHEVPALQTIHNEFGPRGVVVLAVNEREKLADVERFAHDNGINFAVWLDEDGWAGNIYQARSIPTTYFIDEEGIIQAAQIGSMTREQIVAHLEKLL